MYIKMLTCYPNLILVDPENLLDIKRINDEIHEELIRREDLPDYDMVVRRAVRKGDYIVIHAHGSFFGDEMAKFLAEQLEEDSVFWTIEEASEGVIESVRELLPISCHLNNQYRGGSGEISDSNTIDPGIIDLVDAFNAIPGIRTFASCDGHNGARPYYICYTAETMHDAEIVVYFLTRMIEKFYDFEDWVDIRLETSYMPDGVPTGIYFNFQVSYHRGLGKKVSKLGKMIAEEIMRQIEKKNFGSKQGNYFQYDPI